MDISVFFSRTGPSERLTGHKHGPRKAALRPEEGVRHSGVARKEGFRRAVHGLLRGGRAGLGPAAEVYKSAGLSRAQSLRQQTL